MAGDHHTVSKSYPEERPGRETASEGKREKGSVREHVCLSASDYPSGMAVPVTRHASNPPIAFIGRESSNSTNSLPEKDEQYQDGLRVVESGRELWNDREGKGLVLSLLLYRPKVARRDEDVLGAGDRKTIRYPAKVKRKGPSACIRDIFLHG